MRDRFRLGTVTMFLAGWCFGFAGCNRDGGVALPGDEQTKSSGFPSAPHDPLAQVPFRGGPTLGSIDLVTVSYTGSVFAGAISDFGDYVVQSSWLADVGAEYGVRTGTHMHVDLPLPAPLALDATAIGLLLGDAIEAGVLPPVDSHRVYLYYAAPETLLTDNDPSDSCDAFAGSYTPAYHYESQVGGKRFAFGVVPTCAALTVPVLELSSAHELIEAATNPFVATGPAYVFPSDDPWWQTGGELADVCDAMIERDGHTLTRVWSNRAAKNGDNPCQPADTPYTSVAAPKPILLKLGSTMTFPITGWSTAAADPWWVYALPGVYSRTSLSPDLDTTRLDNGMTGNVTVTAPADGKHGDVMELLIYSETVDHRTRFVQPVTITLD